VTKNDGDQILIMCKTCLFEIIENGNGGEE